MSSEEDKPGCSYNWGELESSDEEGNIPPPKAGRSLFKDKKSEKCFCLGPCKVEDIIKILDKDNVMNVSSVNGQCHIANLERCYNKVMDYEKGGETTWARVMFADCFYRYRHELLAALILKTLTIPLKGTDQSFREFGIESDRTPDYILVRDDVHYIFEFTATANEDKSAQMKGIESAGFESKYQKEINMLIKKGYKVEYDVFLFNMLDPDNSPSWQVIESLRNRFNINDNNLFLLKSVSRELSRVTLSIKSSLTLSSGLLFSPSFIIKKDHKNISFTYRNDSFQNDYMYKDFNISMPVYQKINNMWGRLPGLKDRQTNHDDKVIVILELAENRIRFIPDNRGVQNSKIDELFLNNDKQGFFELLKIKIGNKLISATESESGVRFTKKVKRRVLTQSVNSIPLSTNHDEEVFDSDFDIKQVESYMDLINNQKEQLYCPTFYDKDYEKNMLDSMCLFDKKQTIDLDSETFHLPQEPKTLAHNNNENLDVLVLMEKLKRSLIDSNSFEVSIPIKQSKMKSSFILPFPTLTEKDRCGLGYKNVNFLDFLCSEDIGYYTKAILSKVNTDSYSFYDRTPPPSSLLTELYTKRYKLSNKITRIVKFSMKRDQKRGSSKFEKGKLNDFELQEYEESIKEVSSTNKMIRNEEKREGIKRNIGMVRLNCSKNSTLGTEFRKEMAHFKDKKVQSTYEGVGLKRDIELMDKQLVEEFDNLMDTMLMSGGMNDDFLVDLNTYDEVKLLKDLKQFTIDSYRGIIEQAKNSLLGHSAAFVSRFAHSLTFYSQLPFNGSFVRVDNLGYKNVLLIVKGGSKIFKTKSSKLHRLLFPINQSIKSHYIDSSYGPSSFKHLNFEGQDYILTPWLLLNENILLDSISFYPRVMSFCVLNMDCEKTFRSQFHRVFINVILAYHNRRQTESMLANLRYILLSTMGDYSAFQEIFIEFVGFNYDKVQAFLRLQLIKNYPSYYKSMRGIQKIKNVNALEVERAKFKNLFTNYPMYDTDDISLMIYSTFLMTKAPYQKSVERASNLKGIIEIQKLFDRTVGLGLNPEDQLKAISVTNKGDYVEYSKDLMKNDFALDPHYCTNVGLFADSYFEQHVGRDDILLEWIKTLNKNWDSMATTTGLRGMRTDNFFGQKGFFVVYDHILNELKFKEKLSLILDSDSTDDNKRKCLRDLNQTYGSFINKTPERLIYHAVDKRQWRGGREIYVMDMETKRMQQPIEKFMAYLCKKTDTELISIPSDKRSQVIHHALYEKDIPDREFQSWFLTLDCSKWAPKSMFIKFALMIIPMSSIPGTFKTHFLNYLSLLYTKRLYFNKQEVQVLGNNPKHREDIETFMVSDDNVNGYYMAQPYSWVMGIFNYTSSLMHAFNQKYCSYLLRESTLLTFGEDCSLFMFAHSDDSGGRLSVTSKPGLERALFYYEINLKACNHILSKKKCVVSKIYFEILSIIYMFSQLLALLPKFLGGIRFLPTDKGPAHDMLQTYSKGIELMVAGADFNKSYIYQKFYSSEVWRFYYNCKPSRSDYLRPPQYLGMPDAHPIMVLLNGSDSDIIRLVSTGNVNQIIVMHRLFKYIDSFESDEGLIKSLKFIVKIRGVKKGFEDSIETYRELLKSWSLSNVNYKNTGMDSLCFLKKLSDPGFIGALVNETEARRMSRAYFFRSGDSINTKIGVKNLETVFDLIKEVQLLYMHSSDSLFSKFFGEEAIKEFISEIDETSELNRHIKIYFKDIYSNSLKLCDYFSRMDFDKERLKKANRTLKPTHLQIIKFGKGFSTNFDPTQLISSIYEPNLSWSLPNPSNLASAKEDFHSLLSHLKLDKEQMDAGTALKIVRSHQNKSVKEIYMYSCIPGFIRMIKNFSGIITFLSTNSFHNYEIQGMSLKLRENLSSSPINELDIDEQAYSIATTLDVICTLGDKINLNKVKFNPIEEYSFSGGGIVELIENLEERRYSDVNYSYYSHYIKFLKNKFVLWFSENNGEIFDGSCYYTYLKEQKFRGVWYGKGVIAFYFERNWLTFDIFNNKVTSCKGSLSGKIDKRFTSFLIDTFINNSLESCFEQTINKSYDPKNNYYIGYDFSGDISIDNNLNMRSGLPYDYVAHDDQFVTNIRTSIIAHIKGNMFLGQNMNGGTHKIYTLKVDKAEVIPVLKKVLNPASIEDYLLNNGYESYTDFISQSILSSYGAEYYITLQNLSEGYQGSALYELFTETKRLDESHLPTRLVTAKLPAPKGSLLRMILNYQETTGKDLIKVPKELNPSIMAVRNEFPESFSAILNEKMTENFDRIYDDSEQLQMVNEFVKAAMNDDTDKVRSNCIKLMCYWGYSGLVNVLQTYTFNKSDKNYQIFSINNLIGQNKTIFLDLFVKLLKALKSSLVKSFDKRSSYDWPIESLKISEPLELIDQYIIDTAYSSYGFFMYNHHPSLSLIKFNNLLIALLKDSKFIKTLNDELSDDYPLNTLDLGPKNADEFISTLNTLRGTWMKVKGEDQNVKFKYIESYQHLPHGIINPNSLIRELNPSNLKTGRARYHYFLTDSLRHELQRSEVTVYVGNQRCIVKQEVVKEMINEDRFVPTNEIFSFENVLTEDYMETDSYSDISYELDSTDPDIELIQSALEEELDCEIYENTTLKKRGNSILIPVKWVLMPYCESKGNIAKMLNNLGENVVILSNCLINKFWELRNSKIYIVNYSTFEGELEDMVAHVMSVSKVPNSFWDKYIEGRRISDPLNYFRSVYANHIRWSDKIKESSMVGERVGSTSNVNDEDKNESKVPEGVEGMLKPWIKAGVSHEEAYKLYQQKMEKEELSRDIQDSINKYLEEDLIDEKTAIKMSSKYKKALSSKLNIGAKGILSSFLTETELININKGILTGQISENLTATEHIKMMQAPESFGTAFLHSKPDNKAFKDIRYKAELDAIHSELSDLIASSSLTISGTMFRYVKSHYNIWRNSIKGTKHKIENKKFFVNIFTGIVNTSSQHKSSKHDHIWQDIINRMALIIGEEPHDEDTNIYYYLPPSSGLRLKYKTIGLN